MGNKKNTPKKHGRPMLGDEKRDTKITIKVTPKTAAWIKENGYGWLPSMLEKQRLKSRKK
jgi:hypothetical protein